jgi:hypothetical protein
MNFTILDQGSGLADLNATLDRLRAKAAQRSHVK